MTRFCKAVGCSTRSSFGKIGEKPKYCKLHCPDDYVDVRSKRCKNANCTSRPSFGKAGGSRKDAEYCKLHCPDDYVNVINKRCKNPNCTSRPSFGKAGGSKKDAEYCKLHCPDDYVDVRNKRCKNPNCTSQPSFGKAGGSRKDAEYCKLHCPDDYVNVINKRCKNPNCTSHPSFGKAGGSKKDAEYCKLHSPDDYVDVINKRCIAPECKTRPSYNFLGFSPMYCTTHKQPGMTLNPKKKCSECKNTATSAQNGTFYCQTHETKHSISLENICYLCSSVEVPEKGVVCKGCQEYTKNGKTVKRKMKESQIFALLEEEKFPIESYDKSVKGGCSALRPDFILTTEWGAIVLEVDENQHNRTTYTCECEIARMKKIYFDIGTENLLYVRYNPDKYTSTYGKEFSDHKRHDYLIQKLRKYLTEKPEYPCTVIYLFYDGFTHLDPEEEVLDPYAIADYYYECERCSKLYPLRSVQSNLVCKYCE
jgi:arsenate reductase-like glutaredoxin family protein